MFIKTKFGWFILVRSHVLLLVVDLNSLIITQVM